MHGSISKTASPLEEDEDIIPPAFLRSEEEILSIGFST